MNPFILVAIGFLLIFIEFFIPGAVMGVAGGVIILLSVILFAVQDHTPLEVLFFVIAVIASLGFLIAFTLRRIPKAKPGYSIYLKSDQEGYMASSFDSKMIGKKGKVLSDLKPSGHILIEGTQYQAMSQGDYITRGEDIIVIDGKGAYLLVKKFKEI